MLFETFSLRATNLINRTVMSPLTRSRAVENKLMAKQATRCWQIEELKLSHRSLAAFSALLFFAWRQPGIDDQRAGRVRHGADSARGRAYTGMRNKNLRPG